jgi:RNA polymerase sigma-70 factor (ECF subfamily)
MNGDPETHVIHTAQSGRERAWQVLFKSNFDAVYHFCFVLARGHHELAEEIAQQVFIIAARRIHRFDPDRAIFRAWLFGIAKNRNMAIRSSEQRRKRHEESSANRKSETLECKESDLQVHEALAKLQSHYRIVLEDKYLRGLSMNKIAADSGSSIEAIESLLRRARASFARVYEQIQNSE